MSLVVLTTKPGSHALLWLHKHTDTSLNERDRIYREV